MGVGISLEELLTWNEEVSAWWKTYLEAHPELLNTPCDIAGTKTVQDLVRHVWGAELRWSQRLAGLPVIPKEDMPEGPVDALFALHSQAMAILRNLLKSDDAAWSEPYALELPHVFSGKLTMSRRKVVLHELLHGHRHWAQLTTLVRAAGFSSGFRGDLLFSRAIE